MTNRDCQGCKHSGWDPDGPYCANPEVVKKWPYGLSLSSLNIVHYCPAPEHPLFEKREEDNGPIVHDPS